MSTDIKEIKAVFFDLGGTLRIAHSDPAYELEARKKMAELSGTDLDTEAFYKLVEDRYAPYRDWALSKNRESGDEELWCHWLLPDYPRKRIQTVCHELSYQYRQSKGVREVVPHGVEVIKTLRERGYKLGIISNLIGETEVPNWLRDDGLTDCFDSVVLSSVCHLRKPDPEIYYIAARELGVETRECASVADNPARDNTGARAALIGRCILFHSPEDKHNKVPITDENRPDDTIDSFDELLTILPDRRSDKK